MNIYRLLIIISSMVFFGSCFYDDEVHCIDDREAANVTAIDAPETATVNEPVEVPVNFQVKNTCGEFGDFKVSTSEETQTIEVEAEYEGCACAQVLTIRAATYTFTPEKAGEYILKFKSAPENFLQARIIVGETVAEE